MQNDVLFGILLTLLNNRKVSARELSVKYEISTRTVFRYLDVLAGSGVPLYGVSGKGGGISIVDNYKLDRTYFTEEEMARLTASVKSMSTAFKDNLSAQIVDKLSALSLGRRELFIIQSDRLLIDSGPWGLTSVKDKMNLIEKAVVNSIKIKTDYHSRKGEVTARIIEPHALVLKDGVWYTYAYCTLRERFRLFKITRMKNIMEIGETFARREIDLSEAPYNADWYREENLINIILEVNASARLDVEEWLGIENVTPTKRRGFYLACAKVPDDPGLLSKIMSFGSGVKVLEPLPLAERITAVCAEVSGLYGRRI